MKRYTFKTMPVEWRETSTWGSLDTSNLDTKQVERFDRLHRGLTLYMRTGMLTAASREAKCSPSVLIKQLNRCLTATGPGECLAGQA